MRIVSVSTRAALLGVFLAAVFEVAGCGSSSTTVVGPTGTKCQVTATNNTPEVPAAGGNGSLAVSTSRDCTWLASVDAPWITLRTTSGQGAANVSYAVAANPNGTRREGRVIVAEQPVDVLQAGAPCRYQLSPLSINTGESGGQFTATLTATNGCEWSVHTDTGWVGATPVQGTGSATIGLTVGPNRDTARAATVTVGDAAMRVIQAAGSGTGRPEPTPTPAPNPGPTPSPSPSPTPTPPTTPCSYTIKPTNYTAGRGADDVRVDVSTANGCTWTASTSVSWVSIDSGRNSSGNGTVRMLVAANSGPARTAIVMIAGQTFTLNQESSCNYNLKPKSYHSGRGPDDLRVEVTTEGGCTWAASSSVPWVTVVEGQTGVGSGTVRLRLQPNSGQDRRTTLTIAGEPFELRQNGSD